MRSVILRATALLLLLQATVRAEDVPEFPGPSAEHELLTRFVGEWTSEGECTFGPDSEPVVNHATVTSRLIGERWVMNHMEVDAGGTSVTGVQTIGYDPEKKKYVGTWVDSVQNYLWVYEGNYDPATRTLTLNAEGPNMMGDGTLIPYRDTYEFVSDDEIISRSAAQGGDCQWTVFQTSKMRRKAP